MTENCYSCIHRGSLPGDAHSCCQHPDVQHLHEDPLQMLMAILDGSGGEGLLNLIASFNIKANRHGIENGWFMWPYNFDPVWLERCAKHEKANNS